MTSYCLCRIVWVEASQRCQPLVTGETSQRHGQQEDKTMRPRRWGNNLQCRESFLYKSKSVSHSDVSNFLWPHGLCLARLLCPWDSPGQNTGVGCHSLHQGIFPTQGLNLSLLHCRQILYPLSHQGTSGTMYYLKILYWFLKLWKTTEKQIIYKD